MTEDEIHQIINFNRKIVLRRNEQFGVDEEKLRKIFDDVNSNFLTQTYTNNRTRIIKKSSIIIGSITWEQPFLEGNRETALGVGIMFMNNNGFDLPIEKHKKEIYDLLKKIVYKFRGRSYNMLGCRIVSRQECGRV